MAFWKRKPIVDPGGLDLGTSLTLKYGQESWGAERIVLDGIQNHLPGDSKGKNVFIEFLNAGEWKPIAELNGSQPEAVRFRDDGRGYSYRLLPYLFSDKEGEGLLRAISEKA